MGSKLTNWWWLSFATYSSAVGEAALGVTIIQGTNLNDAVRRSFTLGVNPGGEILALQLERHLLPAYQNRDRLLSPAEARELVAAMSSRHH